MVVFPLQIEIKPFINIRNKIGPKTEPCGTPLITSPILKKNSFLKQPSVIYHA